MSDKYWIEYLDTVPAINYETFLEVKLAERDKRIATLEKELKGTQIARESELVYIKSLEKALKDLAELAHMSHTYCEDSWYSCPMAEDGCADESRGPECDCGAVEHNAKIDAIRSSAGYVGEGNE